MRLLITHQLKKNQLLTVLPSVATFLDRASLEPAMQEILNQSPSSPPKRALAHIVLAIGTHILGSESRESSRELPKSCAYDPLVQFSAAIKLKSQILEQSFSVRNFQASITLQLSTSVMAKFN